MARGVVVTLLVGVAFAAATAPPPAATTGAFTYRGTVTRVVDGDTLDIRLASGRQERVRLIGVDTPESGTCYAANATAGARRLALSRAVVLKGDPTQDTRDRYGRLLAYVWIPGGKDLGYQLIAGGFAQVYVFRVPFQRLAAYRSAEASAKSRLLGRWSACDVSEPQTGNCHASYSPCLPIAGDLDCADVRAVGVAPVRVLGSDPYRLDGDDDGLGCE